MSISDSLGESRLGADLSDLDLLYGNGLGGDANFKVFLSVFFGPLGVSSVTILAGTDVSLSTTLLGGVDSLPDRGDLDLDLDVDLLDPVLDIEVDWPAAAASAFLAFLACSFWPPLFVLVFSGEIILICFLVLKRASFLLTSISFFVLFSPRSITDLDLPRAVTAGLRTSNLSSIHALRLSRPTISCSASLTFLSMLAWI